MADRKGYRPEAGSAVGAARQKTTDAARHRATGAVKWSLSVRQRRPRGRAAPHAGIETARCVRDAFGGPSPSSTRNRRVCGNHADTALSPRSAKSRAKPGGLEANSALPAPTLLATTLRPQARVGFSRSRSCRAAASSNIHSAQYSAASRSPRWRCCRAAAAVHPVAQRLCPAPLLSLPTVEGQRTCALRVVQLTPPRSSWTTNQRVTMLPLEPVRADQLVSGSSAMRTSSSNTPSVV